jgi:hypothetical protein
VKYELFGADNMVIELVEIAALESSRGAARLIARP